MSGDPIWYYFVTPVILVTLQLVVLAVILYYVSKIKAWWVVLTANKNYEDCYILSTASQIRARQQHDRQDQALSTKEKLLNQGSVSDRELI